jgi:hypothetical protein
LTGGESSRGYYPLGGVQSSTLAMSAEPASEAR